MPERLETAETARETLDLVTRVLVAQAVALDEMFYRVAKEAFSTEDISYYHARTALKAQARCRATFKVLLALRKGWAAKKFPNLNEETIQALKTQDLPMPYSAGGAPVRPLVRRTPPGHKAPRLTRDSIQRKARWTPERRARQALAIRTWQPWRKSTGPRTEAGKARSARNALKHGLHSKATVEARRQDRRLLASAARNLAIAKSFSATISDKYERPISGLFHSIDIGSATPALIPSPPRITRESRAPRHPPPTDTPSPR